MATAVDEFNRADGSPGASWVMQTTLAVLEIANNAIRCSAQNTGQMYWSEAVNNFGDDQFSQVTNGTVPGLGKYAWVGVRLQGSNGSTSGYIAAWGDSGGQNLVIQRLDNLVSTTLTDTGYDVQAGDVVKLTMDGTALEVFVNGVSRGTASSSTYTGGQPGIGMYGTGNPGNPRVDSWSGGDVSLPPSSRARSFQIVRSRRPPAMRRGVSREVSWGAISGPAGIAGTLTRTLAALSGSGAGSVSVAGGLNRTLATVTSASAGGVMVAGSAARTLAPLGRVSAGAVSVTGNVSRTLATATSAAAGAVGVTGSAIRTLDATTLSASGSVGTTPIAGALVVTLAPLSRSSAGAVAVVGVSARTLGMLTGTSAGSAAVAGVVSRTLAPLTSAASGAVVVGGDLARTLAPLTSTSGGAVAVHGSATPALGAATMSASGTVGTVVIGALARTLASCQVVMSGTVTPPTPTPASRTATLLAEVRETSIPQTDRTVTLEA